MMQNEKSLLLVHFRNCKLQINVDTLSFGKFLSGSWYSNNDFVLLPNDLMKNMEKLFQWAITNATAKEDATTESRLDLKQEYVGFIKGEVMIE